MPDAGAAPLSEHRYNQPAIFRRRGKDGRYEIDTESTVRWTDEPPPVVRIDGVDFRYAGAQDGRLVYVESEE
jgi:hypothetical protein